MNILICGNLGYIGPVVTKHLKFAFPLSEISGLDTGYFASRISSFGGIDDYKAYQYIPDVSDQFFLPSLILWLF